jgi:hypothetical protein
MKPTAMVGLAEKPPGSRVTKSATPPGRRGCQGKIRRPPGFKVLSHPGSGATAPALT